MKITNKQIFNSYKFLNEILQIENFPIETSFKIAKLGKQIQPLYEIVENESNKILMKYGKQDEKNTNMYTVGPEDIEKYNADKETLFNIENDIEGEKITFYISELEERDINIKPALFMGLLDFIEVL